MNRRTVIEGTQPAPYLAIAHEAAPRIRVADRAASRAQLAGFRTLFRPYPLSHLLHHIKTGRLGTPLA
jgi:hypothetical protein